MAAGIGQMVSYESLTSAQKLFLFIYVALSIGFFGFMSIRETFKNNPRRRRKQ